MLVTFSNNSGSLHLDFYKFMQAWIQCAIDRIIRKTSSISKARYRIVNVAIFHFF